ncbi:MAG TPA: hypothetical protein VFR03_01530 [Thermoanaerobaculia bacterium]|nr:hypothetical protein [Thermoanaerobaculia bacterium]
MKIARALLFSLVLLGLPPVAGAQKPRPDRPVPAAMLAGERLQPPELGFSIQRPGPDWEWRYFGSEKLGFLVISPVRKKLLSVRVADSPEPLSMEVAKGYFQGIGKAAAEDGAKLVDLSIQPSSIPHPGSFRCTHHIQGSGKREMYWIGYLVDGGPKRFFVVQELRQSPGDESPELATFVRSLQIVK